MSNKITTQGYFIKRIRDCGYRVDKLFDSFSELDPRAWTIIIDPGVSSLFCTCYINHKTLGDFHFELYDGGQFIPDNFKIKTSSVEILIEYLNKFNVGKVEQKKPTQPIDNKNKIESKP